jgi:glycosyltransferase involved in cell wall biosynthesis
MKLSILIPVYNERTVVRRCLEQVLASPLPENMEREIIMVDDCSNDGTSDILRALAAAHPEIHLYHNQVNQGKGASIRNAVGYATGDFCLIQDADLEYDPSEYSKLLRPLLAGHADAVFGSRYLAADQMRVLPYWHTIINATLTWISNMFSNLKLTDMETCYKVFRTDLLKSIPIRSDRFGIEPELTMKSAKRRFRVYEVPISYHGRTYEEGKKIGWKDGVKALAVILRFWLIDDLYSEQYGGKLLHNLTGTPAYLAWIADMIRPDLGDNVLEMSAGIGNLAGNLMTRRMLYVAEESNPLYLHALRNRFLRTPNVQVGLENYTGGGEGVCEACFDTVLCLNTLEYADNPEETLRAMTRFLIPGGKLVAMVPQSPSLFCAIDRKLGHLRRFEAGKLVQSIEASGLIVEKRRQVNRTGALLWFVFGKVWGRARVPRIVLKIFDKTVWLGRRFDGWLPWPGLSVFIVASKRALP